MASASEEVWVLGIHMTKFGKHPDLDTTDLASQAVQGALSDGGVTMKDMGIIGAGNLMGGALPIGQVVQKQLGQTGIPVYNVSNACANCEATEFKKVSVTPTGEVRAFTIVSFAAPGIPVPYVAAVVDCDGTSVKANLINVTPDPEHVSLGMKVRLATEVIGTDDNGTEAVGFGFEPLGG